MSSVVEPAPEERSARRARGPAVLRPPGSRCVHRLFEAQAARAPDAPALACDGRTLTYRELNARANRLAHHLSDLGVGPEVLVGICLDRSPSMVVALLAVLKAGGAYVPLDPAYPRDRLAWMLADSRVSVLLTGGRPGDDLPEHDARVVDLDRDRDAIARQPEANLAGGATLDNLAYVIYTSGSTGRPKGAMIVHRGLTNYLLWAAKAYDVAAGPGAPVHSSIAFDLTVTSLFAPLIAGRRVDLLGEDLGVEQLAEALRRESGYSLVKITPAHLQLLGQQLAPGEAAGRTRAFVVGGEQLTAEHLAFWREHAPATVVFNEYGPTETVVGCCVYRVPLGEAGSGAIPIGRPIANTRLYVLDRALQPVPVGVAGELYIGGAGVARGYLDRPALTAERFVPDPFGDQPGARLYRSGDLARWRPDGQVEYLGRADDQIKIRGFRVEPGEVEAALRRHPAVRAAAVVARQDGPGERRLVAYLEADPSGPAPTVSELRQFLLGRLPEPMVPSAFVALEALPLSPNGKVDRAALPAPEGDRPALGAAYRAPRTPAEEVVAEVWAGVLGLERVGVDDNFFDLGGHSLLATQVVSRLRQAFATELPLRTLFEAPTAAELAARIEALRAGDRGRRTPPIVPVPREGPLPLSMTQQALWYLDQLAPGQPTFNVTAALRIGGPLDVGALERSLGEVVRRHEALRTTFVAVDAVPVQVIAPRLTLAPRPIDLTGLPEDRREDEAGRLAVEDARRPFDLERGPLVRATLLRLGERDHAILLTMHHIVTDGWSFGVAAAELTTLYAAFRAGAPSPLPELPVQYADFAHWQRGWLRGEVLEELLGYWRRQLAEVPPLDLPTDRPRPAVRTARGAMLTFELPPELSEGLHALSRREGATPFMTLLAAFQALLGRYSGQDDFAVGTPIANRTRPETEGLIGYFVNMLALRADLSGNPTFRQLLGRVRDVALGAYEHQDLPLEVLVEALNPRRDPSRTPLFQVMFVLQNNAMPDPGRLDLALDALAVPEGTGTAKFDLSLGLAETPEGFSGSLEYSTDLFDAATIDRMLAHFLTLLAGAVADPDRRLADLPLLTEPERLQVLRQWPEAPTAPRRRDACIHHLFEAQAGRTPDAEAVVDGERRLSYRELDERADRLAGHLRALGVGPEVRVGLCLRRSAEMLVGLLAVLKAGGAYVALDPDDPGDRLAFMLRDARAAVLLTEDRPGADRPDVGATVVTLGADGWRVPDAPPAAPAAAVRPEHLAYVVYTSGSTGTPKGVMVTHAGLVAAYLAWEDAYGLRPTATRHLQMAGGAFDVFSGDWVRALCSGGTLVVCPRETMLDPEATESLMRRERVDCVEFVPAVAEALATYLEGQGRTLDVLRLIAVGSDMLHAGLYRRLIRLGGPGTRVVNSYGLTEATIDSTYFEGELPDLAPSRPVPIGRPFAGTRVYVLDRHLQPVPPGVPGELYIGGAGVARGYLGRPALTAERFVPDPFGPEPGARLYRTGDLGRWRPDGALELVGRADHQVQFRGFRIEPGEVESALLRDRDVREALVMVRDDGAGGQVLAAYVVAQPGRAVRVEELRRSLKERLPRSMVPSAFVTLEALPRTPSGKVDRAALPAPSRDEAGREQAAAAPRDDLVARLVAIWEEVLGVRPIGVTDDFFDLGGHSLMAVRVTARVEEQLGRKVPLSAFLRGSTVAELANVLRRQEASSPSGTTLVPLDAAGPGRPLFLVHPVGGAVLCYLELARALGRSRPVYGLQAAGLDGDHPPDTRLEAMAARYLDAVRAVQPEGPYLLGGWSLGGVVAFEMARQLREQGADIGALVLIDSRAPAPRDRRPDEARLRAAFADDLAHTSGGDPALVAELGPERLEHLWQVFRANVRALAEYTPRAYPGPLTLVRAGRRGLVDLADPTLGWGALAEVSAHVLPGDHYSLLRGPAVGDLAALLDAAMARVAQP